MHILLDIPLASSHSRGSAEVETQPVKQPKSIVQQKLQGESPVASPSIRRATEGFVVMPDLKNPFRDALDPE